MTREQTAAILQFPSYFYMVSEPFLVTPQPSTTRVGPGMPPRPMNASKEQGVFIMR
jgi:hypothetical protein